MSKFAEAVEKYKKSLNDLGIKYDEALLTKVTKGLVPSIYLRDASTVSCSDKTELDRVKTNFLSKKLGIEGAKADKAVADVCEQYKSSRLKYRAVFYYLLVTNLGKESFYA